ncbi:hypothetical protein CfE428DRAFT_1347 [Chthoniobacter flavus Ellin428]|uniref:Uncharacterized protein n=1 Tax=Chthoniobacter flavus Ellin428 TaxID=497964 RepID=B4CXQ6_9BACT|nr:glycoside hydrolase family 75 protein [Chthoniobacter flavus]EDY21054.1 hypothetical protein CfE428DRAFT_1347 [Chthoniobacter flavus Ellin428]TCO88776.1 chitosanase (glycosyl hydrolase group 75) [Chthoniobacter flavus]
MFTVPPASAATLGGIDFSVATPVAGFCQSLFDTFDRQDSQSDPSQCKAILRFPSGVISWSSKLAIDADGVAADPGRRCGTQLDPLDGQNDTSFHFPNGCPLSSERHPFIVLPLGVFRAATGLSIGDLAVVIYRDILTAAICGDLGPSHKIGEGSIRVHEAFHPPAPDPCAVRNPDGSCRRIHDASIEQDVLFFVFPGSAIGSALTPDNAEMLIKARAFALFAQLHSPSA